MKRILIIEDDLIVRSIYRRKFEMSGYKVEAAEDGPAALGLLPDFKPDVIQVDIMLPGMDGVEVIRNIKAQPEFKQIPVLVLSSFYRPDLAKEAWKAGANKCVSKMDCTPNLALDLVEQLLADENSGFTPTYGTIPLARDALDAPDDGAAPKSPSAAAKPEPPVPAAPKLRVALDLPASTGAGPSLPKLAGGKKVSAPAPSATAELPGSAASGAFLPAPAPPAPPEPASEVQRAAEACTGSDFRVEVRQDFLRRVPQIQAELQERVSALLRSKSTNDQLSLLRGLEVSVNSLAGLSGITGFARISHLSGALVALLQELHRKPTQMTASVLRTVAHASDCINLLFRDMTRSSQNNPQSLMILAVDDEPISRRTVAIALAKANFRCVGIEDPLVALTLLKENPFDLIFLDADMPGLNGFELCAEIRKMPTNSSTPVIFVTSLTNFDIRAQSSLSGGNDLIAKPFLMMELAVKALTYLLKPPATLEA